MNLTIRSLPRRFAVVAALLSVISLLDLPAAEESAQEKQAKLIALLQSQAPPQEKAVACKRLAVYGDRDAVAALAPMLSDPELASWARIALENIPDPAADAALREALNKVEGRLLIGVMNSIGVRRDPQAIGALTSKLKDGRSDIASGAAAALGRIGGDPAARALEQALDDAPSDVRSEVALGLVRCAERYWKESRAAEAVRLYDRVRQAPLPKQRLLEATRGAILARRTGGLPLLLEQLRSADKGFFAIGLRTARELPGRDVTEALAAELGRLAAERQALLLMAVADRGDAVVLPTVGKLAQSGPRNVRLAAIAALERLDKPAGLPLLIEAATGDDAAVAQAAKSSAAKLSGPEVDAAVASRLSEATGKTRQALIEVAGLRHTDAALPAVVRAAEDADSGIRSAAIGTLGSIGEAKQAGDLVRLLQKTESSRERAEIEKALLAISSRQRAACLEYLLPLAQNIDSALRMVALHALGSVGGPNALSAVKGALEDNDDGVQDEAVRTLSTWASNWPEDSDVAAPLLTLAKTGKKNSHRVQGVRGYLQWVQESKKLSNQDKLARVEEILPLIKRPEEKRLVIAAISSVPTASSLQMLANLAADEAIAEEAYLAIVNLAGKRELQTGSKELRQKSLQTVLEKSTSERARTKADELLKKLR